jgi:hypothetical protein
MKTVHLKSHVGADGILNLRIPTGIFDSDLDVIVVVDRSNGADATVHRKEWSQFIHRTAGSIDDPTFTRHEQGEFENREPLP